jgi:hypothetical protein
VGCQAPAICAVSAVRRETTSRLMAGGRIGFTASQALPHTATVEFAAGEIPRGSRFVEPRLVCEVEFTEWTSKDWAAPPSFL